MLSIPFRKINLVLLLLTVLGLGAVKSQPSHYFDVRPFNLGFTMGMGIGGYDMTHQINQTDPRTGRFLQNVSLVRKPAIYLGLITSVKLTNHIDIRFTPSVTLEERDFRFRFDSTTTFNGESVVYKKIESSNLNLPIFLKFKTDYYKRTRLFVTAGIQPVWNLASTKKVRNDPELLKTEKFDVAFVTSVGIDLYGEKLKLSPELRYTRGLRNLYVPDNTVFPRAISDLFSQLLTLNINFE